MRSATASIRTGDNHARARYRLFRGALRRRKAVALGNQDISGSEAWHRLEANAAGRWASGPSADPAEGTAWHRINAVPFFEPMVKPEFSISSTDRIFALGSCFARHVEGALFSSASPSKA